MVTPTNASFPIVFFLKTPLLQFSTNKHRGKMEETKCATCKKPAKMACSGCKEAPILDGDAPPVITATRPAKERTGQITSRPASSYEIATSSIALHRRHRNCGMFLGRLLGLHSILHGSTTNEDDMQMESMATGQPSSYREALNLHGHNLEADEDPTASHSLLIFFHASRTKRQR